MLAIWEWENETDRQTEKKREREISAQILKGAIYWKLIYNSVDKESPLDSRDDSIDNENHFRI